MLWLRSCSGCSVARGPTSMNTTAAPLSQLLLVRTARSVSLTDDGRRLVESAGPALGQAIDALTASSPTTANWAPPSRSGASHSRRSSSPPSRASCGTDDCSACSMRTRRRCRASSSTTRDAPSARRSCGRSSTRPKSWCRAPSKLAPDCEAPLESPSSSSSRITSAVEAYLLPA